MKVVQCYEFFRGIALKNHVRFFIIEIKLSSSSSSDQKSIVHGAKQ